jgi:hypothetical protein
MMHLWCDFYVSRPMLAEAQLDGLQSVINELLPKWSVMLRAAEYEFSRDRVDVGRESRLYNGVRQVAHPKRGLGRAILYGADKRVSMYLSHCDGTLPPELNDVSIEVYNRSTVEGQTVSDWARNVFDAIAGRLPIRYAFAHADEEYAAKNMIQDERSAKAIGANIEDAIPGLYWLNYFGATQVALMGRERLLTAPAYEVKPISDGVFLALDPSAEAWQNADYQQRERAVIAHLGEQFFFSRWDPDRRTVAPIFRANCS